MTEEDHDEELASFENYIANGDEFMEEKEWTLAIKEYDKAIQELEDLRETNPDAFENDEVDLEWTLSGTFHKRSNAHFKKMDIQKALMDINAAVELDPDDPYIWNSMGLIYSQMRRFKKAAEYYGKASQLDPDEGLYHHNMGVVFQDDGNDAVAKRCFKKSEELGYDLSEGESAF